MEQFLYALLSGDTALHSLVGTNIFPSPLDTDAELPYVAYFRNDTSVDRKLNGRSGLTKYTAQIEYWSLNAKTTNDIGTAIENLLEGFRDDNCLGCFQQLSQLVDAERGFHGVQLYTINLRSS